MVPDGEVGCIEAETGVVEGVIFAFQEAIAGCDV